MQVVQHAAWSAGPLEIPRSSVLVWSSVQRFASLLSLHGLIRAVDTADRLSLSPSPVCAAMLSDADPDGAERRRALVAAVSHRDPVLCRELLDAMTVLSSPAKGKRKA